MASRATNLSVTSLGVAALILGGSVLWFGLGPTDAPADFADAPVAPTSALIDRITVHISGAVRNPGVVVAEGDARVADIVLLAGGAVSDAALSRVNLAATVRDGDRIIVPSLADALTDDGGGGWADGHFDLNTATAADFETLPGVGPVLASRIVAHRDNHGPFDTIEDLLDVAGIGEAKLAAIRSVLEQR